MNTECSRFRSLIPRSLLVDIGAGESEALNGHIAECAPCRDEQELYRTTLGHLRADAEVAAPRHFFVYEEAVAPPTPWRLFRRLSPVWQTALGTAAVATALFLSAAASQLHVRVGHGALTVAFGAPPAAAPATPPAAFDTAALETRILSAVGERNRAESEKLLQIVRGELAVSSRRMTSRQRALLQTALDSAEVRIAGNFAVALQAVQARNEKSLASVYEAVTLQQQRDRNVIESRIDRLAVSGEAKNSQTDAILQTLLEVAELRMK